MGPVLAARWTSQAATQFRSLPVISHGFPVPPAPQNTLGPGLPAAADFPGGSPGVCHTFRMASRRRPEALGF